MQEDMIGSRREDKCVFPSNDTSRIFPDHSKKCHEQERPYSCKYLNCSYRSKREDNLRTHIKYVHLKVRNYFCKLCAFGAVTPSALLKHRRIHTGERPFQCPACGKAFASAYALKLHSFLHSREKPYVCDYPSCDYSAVVRSSLTNHKLSVHQERNSYECDECKYSSRNLTWLRRHFRRRHGGERERPFSCSICDYRATTPYCFKKHLASHTKDYQFRCSKCNYKCASNYQLNSHAAQHDESLRIQCNVPGCSYKGANKALLSAHFKAIHLKCKQFHCNLCDRYFSTKGSLEVHMRTHTGERPFKCQHCDHTAATNSNLRWHCLSKHSNWNDRPFPCSFCRFRAKRRDSLVRHMRVHTKEIPFLWYEAVEQDFAPRRDELLTHPARVCTPSHNPGEGYRLTNNGIIKPSRFLAVSTRSREKSCRDNKWMQRLHEHLVKFKIVQCYVNLKKLRIITK